VNELVSPDGRHVYFQHTSNVAGNSQVQRIDLRTGTVHWVANAPDAGSQPVWGRQRLASSRW